MDGALEYAPMFSADHVWVQMSSKDITRDRTLQRRASSSEVNHGFLAMSKFYLS